MFNAKKHKIAQITSQEKYLRQNPLGPVDNSGDQITEKEVPHRQGDQYVTIEKQMDSARDNEKESQIIEKVLNSSDGKYVDHRKAEDSFVVTPINELVEKMRHERLSKDWKPEKKEHWSQTMDEKKQQGSLPKWPKNAPQKHTDGWDPSTWDSNHTPEGSAKFANSKVMNKVTSAIKSGESIKYDSIIVAILQQAKNESRDLTSEEQKAISDLKIARTKFLMQ